MALSHILIIAHRGASAYAPENTLAAFDLALQLRIRHLELDVHLTSDAHVVVIHDDTEAVMRQVVEAGADGMTVNFPDKLLAYSNSHFSHLVGKQPQPRLMTVADPPGSAAILAASGAGETPALPGKGRKRCCVPCASSK